MMDLATAFLNSEYNAAIHTIMDNEGILWFNSSDIANVLAFNNIRMHLKAYNSSERKYFEKQTSRGVKNATYLSVKGLQKLLTKSRKAAVNKFAQVLGINVYTNKFTCVEADSIDIIEKTFSGEDIIKQYKVGQYYIDMYLPKYRIAIECDENHHKNRQNQDDEREKDIREHISDIVFIRFCPYDDEFDIYKVLNEVFKTIIIKTCA
jgi:very-short-patch-repair endonuclease